MTSPSSSLRVGLDYRPGLQNREGIGRYARELVQALAQLPEAPKLGLYGSTWTPPRVRPMLPAGARMRRWRIPSRVQPWLLKATAGADGFLGGTDVFHHTQYNRLPVQRAVEVATLHDCIYLLEPEFVGSGAALRMGIQARALAARAARILVPSEYVQKRVVETFQVPIERVVVTPLGCEHATRAVVHGNVPGLPYLLTVARIEPRKNHLRMLRAFEGVVAAGFPHRWTVAGPVGHGADEFLDALARSPVRSRVDWLSEVDEARLASLLAGASLFLFTSLSEGFGLPPLEAMAHGVPVVASETTSVGEVCGSGASLVDPLDVDGTREAVCALLADGPARQRGVARALERAAQFTWGRCAERTLEAYRAAVLDPRP